MQTFEISAGHADFGSGNMPPASLLARIQVTAENAEVAEKKREISFHSSLCVLCVLCGSSMRRQ